MAAPSLTVPPFTPPTYVVGSGGQSVFPFSFPFWDVEDIVVTLNGVQLVLGQYAVAGYSTQSGAQVSGGFGSGAVTIGGVVNATVVIDRFVNPERNSVYGAGLPLPVSALNADFNRLVAMLQDVSRRYAGLQASVAALIASLPAQITAGAAAYVNTLPILLADTGTGA